MPNTIIDVEHNIDPNNITSERGGAVTKDVRVTIREGVSKSEAHKALLVITSALACDQVELA